MRIAIAGAGAIGAYMGALLARNGEDVHLLARGAQLAAFRERGIRVVSRDGEFTVHAPATNNPGEVGPVQLLVLAVKAHGLPRLAPTLAPMMDADTIVLAAQNGVPWWFVPDMRLERVDPGGVIAASIEKHRVIGGIVYFAAEVPEPGLVRHVEGSRLTLGEPEGGRSDRVRAVAEVLGAAGLRCPITAHLREDIWVKLMGNVVFNPMSALTGATLAGMARHPESRKLAAAIMEETMQLGRALGIEVGITIEQRIEGAAKIGEHKTSMLQDLEAGRPFELDAITGAVLEMGARLGIPMPHTQSVYACTRLLAATRGLE